MITRDKFIEATGREPQDDDLERANCRHAGAIGHFCCGWDWRRDLPRTDAMALDLADTLKKKHHAVETKIPAQTGHW